MPVVKFVKTFLTVFLLFIFHLSYCQFYSAGQDPHSIEWKQINTDNFQVIFPSGFDEQASYVADVLEHVYHYGSESLEYSPVRVSVILHNQTVVSNGFVSWAPRRIEMYSNPPQTNDVHDWLERLAVHEFRHVVQIDKLNQGMTRLLYFLFGEQAVGAVLGLYVPLWFLEGDAVAIETALTHGGRGRSPAFEKGLRAQLMEKELYSFDKAVFGSYKDHVPNHYELGYQIVAATRAKYGTNVWAGVLDNVAKRPYSIIPFSKGIKNNTGFNKTQLYHNTFNYLDSAWSEQHEKTNYTPKNIINKKQKHYTSYNHIHFVDEETLIALKTSLDDIPRIIELKTDGSEKVLFTPGWYLPNSFSYSSGIIAWAEYQQDWRWEHRNWSVIHTYNIAAEKKQRITNKTRLFAPAISPGGTKIAAVKTTEDYKSFLVILDINSGEEINSFSLNENDFILTPAWHSSGKKIALIAQNDQGKRLVEIDISTNKTKDLWHAGYTEITNPVYYDDNIIFSGAFTGIDNLYIYDRTKNDVYMVVSSEFGAYQPAVCPEQDYIAWSDYNSEGYQTSVINIDTLDKTPIYEAEDHSVGFHKKLAQQENSVVNPNNVKQKDHPIEPYYRFPNLFNPHSWGLAYVDASNYRINPGASVMFQNMLSTSFATLGYVYDLNDEAGKWKIQYSYKGFYPVIDFVAETGARKGYYTQDDVVKSFPWQETIVGAGIRVPLSFNRYAFQFRVEPSIRKVWMNVKMDSDSPDFLRDNKIRRMEYRLTSSWYRRTTARDIMPRLGQFFDINYRNTPFKNGDMGSVFSARAIQYLPGIFKHHSIRLSASYQERTKGVPTENTINYSFPNLINYPSGITGQYHQQLQSYQANYALPLFYPDLSIPPLFYIKRVWSSMFYDYAVGKNNDEPSDYFNVAGFSLYSDMHIFRFLYPFTLGGRLSYDLRKEDIYFNFLFNVNF